jgi:hypothetical protein
VAKTNYFRISTTLAVAAVAAAFAALLEASAPALGQYCGEWCGPEFTFPLIADDSVSPAAGETGVYRDSNVEVYFSSNMDPTTIDTITFTLVKQGTSTPTPVEATVTYDDIDNLGYAVLDPKADLEAKTIYTATIKGGEKGVKEASGAPMSGDYSWSFTTGDSTTPPADTTPPETTIDSGPGNGKPGEASFSFSSSEPDSTFECSLDNGTSWSTCTSPKAYSGLSAGLHTFVVKATDKAGNRDTSPASRSWTEMVDNADSNRFFINSNDPKWQKGTFSTAYGADHTYRYRQPARSGYYAYYKVNTPTAGKYDVYAWWPKIATNNTSTAFWVYTTTGWSPKISKNQKDIGDSWVYLGTFPMNAADDWNISVDYGSSSSTKGNIIADAVRIVPHQQ